jgi:hypothetical protein
VAAVMPNEPRYEAQEVAAVVLQSVARGGDCMYPAVRYVGVRAVTSTTGGLHVNQSVPALGTES